MSLSAGGVRRLVGLLGRGSLARLRCRGSSRRVHVGHTGDRSCTRPIDIDPRRDGPDRRVVTPGRVIADDGAVGTPAVNIFCATGSPRSPPCIGPNSRVGRNSIIKIVRTVGIFAGIITSHSNVIRGILTGGRRKIRCSRPLVRVGWFH